MGLKLFGAGGIDQKSNNLLRADIDLINSRNVMINTNNEYVKRPGTEEDTSFTDDDYSDMIFIKSMDQYFHRFGSDYITYENGVRKQIYKWADPLVSGESKISLAEYLNTAIFTHEENQNFTAKYDGESIYKSGLPAPEFSIVQSGTAVSGFVLAFIDYIDAKGNQLFGPATIKKVTNETLAFTFNTLKDTGFNGRYLLIDTYPGYTNGSTKYLRGNGTTAERSIVYTSKSNDIIVGSKIIIRNSFYTKIYTNTPAVPTSPFFTSNFFYLSLEVESIDTGTKTIVFKADSFPENYAVTLGPAGTAMDSSAVWRICYSLSEATGYAVSSAFNTNPLVTIDNSLNTNSGARLTYGFYTNGDLLLSDIYDITTSKLRPPKCKYVFTYGYQLVCGNVISFYDFENKETKYTNNDLVMYSDLSTGDLGENFSESNRQLIGNTYDGQISGLGRVKDSLIAFKDKMVFAMDGVLIPGQYTLRKIETNEIGCTSFKSILSVENALMFQGQDGIYVTDGYKAEKASTNLDPFFGTIDNTLTRSVMNNIADQYLFWTNQGIVVFDYHHKKWFIWDSVDASSGITVDNDLSIRFFSALKSTKFQTDLNDSGVAIDAYIRSDWHDLGEPGLLKKATFLRLYSFNNSGQKISLRYYLNWSEDKCNPPISLPGFVIDMSDADTKTVKKNLDIIQNQSFSFEFRNNVIDEDLNISGYEINAEIIQERDKNVK